MNLNLELAVKMIEKAEEKAVSMGVPMVISVVDHGGNLIAQHRMDKAPLASIDISLNKAYTALAVKEATHKFGKNAEPGEEIYGINTTNDGKLVLFGGGYPIKNKSGEVIGGIGSSGGAVEEDMKCAKSGLSVLD